MDKNNELIGEEKKRRRRKNDMAPLVSAAKRVSKLLCELSADRELFVTEPGQKSEKRLDTKALKEFSGVLKEMSAVMSELKLTDDTHESDGILIEFSDEVSDMSV